MDHGLLSCPDSSIHTLGCQKSWKVCSLDKPPLAPVPRPPIFVPLKCIDDGCNKFNIWS